MRNPAKHKGGQFYVFAALIFISFIFFIASNQSRISLSKEDPSQAYLDNYIYEGKIVINYAIRQSINISSALSNFTESFITYTRSKDLDVGILSMYSYQQKIFIVNYLKDPILITSGGIRLNPGEETALDFAAEVDLNYQNESYRYYFSSPTEPEFKVLFVKS